MQIYKLTASQLANLLQILGALTADYINNPSKPMQPDLAKIVATRLEWKDLPGLGKAIQVSLRGGDKLSALYNLGAELRDALPAFKNNRDYSSSEIQMLRALRSYLSTDSESALNYIKKHAGVFKNPLLAKLFLPDVPKADNTGLRNTVRGLVGRDGTFLTVDESKMLKETNPKAYEKYLSLRKVHNQSFKASLATFVRDSGKSKVPYTDAYKAMLDLGFNHSMVPGFTGLVDDQGRWFTQNGLLIGGVPNLTTYDHVVMNPKGEDGSEWVFKAVKPDGTYAHYYTADFRRTQSVAKYKAVGILMKKIPTIRKVWLQRLREFDITNKESVCAVVLEILYTFAARIGSQPGRGVGTLLVKNSSETSQGINLAYIGKDSIPTKHIIKTTASKESAMVVKALEQLREGKNPSMPLFTYEKGGKLFLVKPADVNKAFRTFGAPAELSVHKLRTCRGTTLFQMLLDKEFARRPPATEKEALQRYKVMTEQIGKLLNHKRGVGSANEKVTGATAATSYIDADLQIALWDRWGFRPPAVLEKLMTFDV